MCENARGEHGLNGALVTSTRKMRTPTEEPAEEPLPQKSQPALMVWQWESRDAGQYTEYEYTGGE